MAKFTVKASEPKAHPKEPGMLVVTDSTVTWQQDITHTALAAIVKGLEQKIRDKYDGHADWTYSTSKHAHDLSVKFSRRDGSNVLIGNWMVPDERLSSASYRKDLAYEVANSCISMIRNDYAPGSEQQQEEIPPKKKDKPKKVACKLCGPEDPYYPPWQGECPHEELKRKKNFK